jgi:hypothetical protein
LFTALLAVILVHVVSKIANLNGAARFEMQLLEYKNFLLLRDIWWSQL